MNRLICASKIRAPTKAERCLRMKRMDEVERGAEGGRDKIKTITISIMFDPWCEIRKCGWCMSTLDVSESFSNP